LAVRTWNQSVNTFIKIKPLYGYVGLLKKHRPKCSFLEDACSQAGTAEALESIPGTDHTDG
jgi:hypothetical protein